MNYLNGVLEFAGYFLGVFIVFSGFLILARKRLISIYNKIFFKKLHLKFAELAKKSPYFKKLEEPYKNQYSYEFRYNNCLIRLKIDLKLIKRGTYGDRSYYREIECKYYLEFEKAKPLTVLTVIRLPKLLNYLKPSTANLPGNEDKKLNVIYEHTKNFNKEEIKQQIQQLLPHNLIEELKLFPWETKLVMNSTQATLQMNKFPKNNEELKSIFGFLVQLSEVKLKAVSKSSSELENYSLKLMDIILSSIQNHKIEDDSYFSPEFSLKFADLVKNFTAPGRKLNISMAGTPLLSITEKNTFWKVRINTNFLIAAGPHAYTENEDSKLYEWELIIDKTNRKLIGMKENVWGEFRIK